MEGTSLTDTQKKDTQLAYDEFNEEEKKGLSQLQARNALFKLGIKATSIDIEKFWFDIDKSEVDLLTLDEFIKLRCSINADPAQTLRWAFNKFDKNNDGTIDKNELKNILAVIYDDAEGDFVDDEFVGVCITLADKNNDGVLQIEEFVDMLMQRTGNDDGSSDAPFIT